ncbi:MAG: UDP-2,3-diacylglucosamine diphosphatase [Legionellaceae bacterium]|nr:UDP-2,3-diacylglucosamine diphosphatase [Legionellaceae bacterium]
MLEAVFISDLHLGPQSPAITLKFQQFCQWAVTHTRAVYILGDFFHAWPGDDYAEDWLLPIYEALALLVASGTALYFIKGNRDFLVGSTFLSRFQIRLLEDPAVVCFQEQKLLLSHGDRYCSKDKPHQWFRRVTRNSFFSTVFLSLPLKLRKKLVLGVRQYSENNKLNQIKLGVADPVSILQDLKRFQCQTLIHGHTHKPALHKQVENQTLHCHYVLSDWDDKPLILCYDKPKGLYFLQVTGELHGSNRRSEN